MKSNKKVRKKAKCEPSGVETEAEKKIEAKLEVETSGVEAIDDQERRRMKEKLNEMETKLFRK